MKHSKPGFLPMILAGPFLTFLGIPYSLHKTRAIDVLGPYLVKYTYYNKG